jgi:hypothetical protein
MLPNYPGRRRKFYMPGRHHRQWRIPLSRRQRDIYNCILPGNLDRRKSIQFQQRLLLNNIHHQVSLLLETVQIRRRRRLHRLRVRLDRIPGRRRRLRPTSEQ